MAGLVCALPALAGCSASFSAQTNQPYQPAEGISNRLGQIYALDTLVVADHHGHGTLVTALDNQKDTPDKLLSVQMTTMGGIPLKVTNLTHRPIRLPPHQAVQFAYTGHIRVSGTPKTLQPGGFARITFTFDQAAPLDMQIPVVEQTSDFAGVPVGHVPAVKHRHHPARTPPTTPAHPQGSAH